MRSMGKSYGNDGIRKLVENKEIYDRRGTQDANTGLAKAETRKRRGRKGEKKKKKKKKTTVAVERRNGGAVRKEIAKRLRGARANS